MKIGTIVNGNIIFASSRSGTTLLEDALILVDEDGVILEVTPDVASDDIEQHVRYTNHETTARTKHVRLQKHQFLIPGFVDTHNHAPQWAQRGLGRGLQIIDWLNEVTFKNEAKFHDLAYARRIYAQCVDGFLQQGITTVSYYGSLHGEATKVLADLCLEKGQRALIGKCNMDRNGATFYQDKDAQTSLKETQDLIEHIRQKDPSYSLIRPVLTPRFAICCTEELLQGLGELAKQHQDVPVQTHFNEARSEIDFTMSLFPQFKNEADLYRHYGLLDHKSILAHCTHMTPYEIGQLKELNCGVAHCPISNTTVGGGFMVAPIREFLRQGIKVGLGTDSGGGFSSSILDAMRQAFIVSNAGEMLSDGKEPNLSIDECFYMATVGGAKVCGLDDKVGDFTIGKEFDALLIDPSVKGVMTMVEDEDSLRTVFEKFLMSGDDRNIIKVWIRGREVK